MRTSPSTTAAVTKSAPFICPEVGSASPNPSQPVEAASRRRWSFESATFVCMTKSIDGSRLFEVHPSPTSGHMVTGGDGEGGGGDGDGDGSFDAALRVMVWYATAEPYPVARIPRTVIVPADGAVSVADDEPLDLLPQVDVPDSEPAEVYISLLPEPPTLTL